MKQQTNQLLRKIIREELKKVKLTEQTYVIEPMSDENFSRMDGLVTIQTLQNFLRSAEKIMTELDAEGFEAKEVFDYLYLTLIANV